MFCSVKLFTHTARRAGRRWQRGIGDGYTYPNSSSDIRVESVSIRAPPSEGFMYRQIHRAPFIPGITRGLRMKSEEPYLLADASGPSRWHQ